ncbi:MAG: hypothetical protein ACYDDA_16355 [Acidiferrobacteraceae bacterium]
MSTEASVVRGMVGLWFVGSIFLLLGGRIAFVALLFSKGVPFSLFLAGVPGYLERRYVQWCVAESRPEGRWVLFQKVALASTIISGAIALAVLPASK